MIFYDKERHPDSALDRLIGAWRSSGRHGDGSAVERQENFARVAGGHFLVHSWRVAMPEGPSCGIEVLRGQAETDAHSGTIYDNGGSINPSSLTIRDEGTLFAGEGWHYRPCFAAPDRIEGYYEMQPRPNAPWQHWFDSTMTEL